MASSMWKLFTFAALGFFTTVTSAQTLGWTPLGCFHHDPTAQPLRYSAVPSLTSDTTVENCQAACAAKSFPYAGIESGYQCWCDTAIQGGATPQAASYCNQQCYGDLTETCGGYKYLNIFQSPSIAPSRTTSSPASTWSFSWVIPGYTSSEPITLSYPATSTWSFSWVIPGSSRSISTTSLSYPTTSTSVPSTTSSGLSISISETSSWTSTYGSSPSSMSSPIWTSESTSSKRHHHTTSTKSSTSCTDTTTSSSPSLSSSSSTKHHHHSSTSPISYTTSTIYSTTSYKITSCLPTVISCPYGSTTTATIAVSTTICPVAPTTPALLSGTTPTAPPTSTTEATSPPLPPPATKTYTKPLVFTSASVPLPQESTSAPPLAQLPAQSTSASISVPPQGAPSSTPSVTPVINIWSVSAVPSSNSISLSTNLTGNATPKPSPSALQVSAGSVVGFGVGDLLVAGWMALILII